MKRKMRSWLQVSKDVGLSIEAWVRVRYEDRETG